MTPQDNLREIAWIVRHDPLLVIGPCLIGLVAFSRLTYS
jgi:hypothetical protein